MKIFPKRTFEPSKSPPCLTQGGRNRQTRQRGPRRCFAKSPRRRRDARAGRKNARAETANGNGDRGRGNRDGEMEEEKIRCWPPPAVKNVASSIGRNPPSSSSSSSTAQNSPAQVHVVGKTVRLLFYTVYRVPVHRYSDARSRVYPRHRRLRPRLLPRPRRSPAAAESAKPNRFSGPSLVVVVFFFFSCAPFLLYAARVRGYSSGAQKTRTSAAIVNSPPTPAKPHERLRFSPPSPSQSCFLRVPRFTRFLANPSPPFTRRRYPFAYTTRPPARVSRANPSALSGRVCVYVHVCACVPPSRYAHLCAGGDLNARPPAGNVREQQHATSGRDENAFIPFSPVRDDEQSHNDILKVSNDTKNRYPVLSHFYSRKRAPLTRARAPRTTSLHAEPRQKYKNLYIYIYYRNDTYCCVS